MMHFFPPTLCLQLLYSVFAGCISSSSNLFLLLNWMCLLQIWLFWRRLIYYACKNLTYFYIPVYSELNNDASTLTLCVSLKHLNESWYHRSDLMISFSQRHYSCSWDKRGSFGFVSMICTTLPGHIYSSQECTKWSSPTVLTIKSNIATPSRWVILFPRNKIFSQYCWVKMEKSVASTETVNLITVEGPHWPVKENMGNYQVVVLHVNTSNQKIGKWGKIHCESSNFQECNVSRNTSHSCTFVLCYAGISINTT